QHLRTSVATFEALPEHAGELAQALIELSLVLARRGSLDDAEGALGRAESIAANLPQRGTVADNAATRRADLVRARGDRQKAKAILEPVVARMLAERGATDRSALLAVNLYAGVLHELGELQPAEELYRKAHEGLLATKGPDHPETLATLNNLLMVQFGQGRRRDALPTLQRLLDVRRRVLGDDHPDTITTLSNLGSVQFLLGDYAAAVPAFREASERILAREGDQHPAYAAILGNLASAEREVKEFASAIEHADKALALRRAKLGPTHDTTLTLFAMAADLRRFVGESQQAFEQLQECRRLAQEAKPPQIANVYRCEMGIARALAELGRLDEAEAMFVRCVETWEAADKKLAARGQLGKVDKELADLRTRMGKTPPK
ncbi:MAG: tetratricopeptide repeat protein, partial [Planctomycetes bacterium]|nr:tetratricopeptide repeat protein [Planctomycetota bacterium]